MAQTISSIFFYVYYPLLINPNYLPLNQPLTAKDPIRRFEVYIDLSTLESRYPLNTTEDNPLNAESIFFNPPFHCNL